MLKNRQRRLIHKRLCLFFIPTIIRQIYCSIRNAETNSTGMVIFMSNAEIMLKNVGMTYKTNGNRDVTALTNVTMNQDSKL